VEVERRRLLAAKEGQISGWKTDDGRATDGAGSWLDSRGFD